MITHPKLGTSWEGFALGQTVEFLNLNEAETFFWAVHTGAELDLLFSRKGKMWGVEVKYTESPKLTKSMKTALEELSLAHLWVIYPGQEVFSLDERVTAIPLQNLQSIKVQ